jgi:hypothetical protein
MVIKAKHVRGYLIEVKFNDGTKKDGSDSD